jgi:opacity protein-like surface antigen
MLSSSVLFAQRDSTTTNDSTSSTSIRVNEATISGGISLPYLPEETRHYLKTGWNAGVGVGMSFKPGSMGYGSVEATIDFNRFAFDNLAFQKTLPQSNIAVSRNPTTALTFMLNLKGTFFVMNKSIAPYFLLGIGGSALSVGDIVVSGDTSFTLAGNKRTAFAWTAGVGIDVPITNTFSMFVQGRSLLIVMDESRQYFPLSAGIRFRRE